MTTTIHPLDAEDREMLDSLVRGTYLDGECYAFATALYEGTGWPLYGLVDEQGVVHHAVVACPDGHYFDARGYITREKLAEPFTLPRSTRLRPISLEEIGLRENEHSFARENSVRNARILAEALWPELPWKHSLALRVKTFCDELEELSRKHRLWIRALYPGARPVFALGEDDEEGYELWPTADARSFTLDRLLES